MGEFEGIVPVDIFSEEFGQVAAPAWVRVRQEASDTWIWRSF